MVVVQRIVDGLAVAAEADELCVLQHPQLVAHRRLAELDGVCDVLHAKLVVVEGIEDLDAGGVAEHPEQVGQLIKHLIIRQHRRGLGQLFGGSDFFSHRCHPFVFTYEHLFMYS